MVGMKDWLLPHFGKGDKKMDLRSKLNGDIRRAESVLNYQPFMLSDDVQTGVAYSWARAGDPRPNPKLVIRRNESEEEWHIACAANGMLRILYDDLLDMAASAVPGGTLLDVACNNGYFSVGAELRGMRGFGSDMAPNYSNSIGFLNEILGTRARFFCKPYDSRLHKLPIEEKFDVTIVSAIMCHLPDPLFFLKEVAGITNKMMLFWGQVIETDARVIAYSPPHPSLSKLTDFPYSFNDNTRISIGMFKEASKLLGFSKMIRIEPKQPWMYATLPNGDVLENPARFRNVYANDLHQELNEGSGHAAIMFVR